jgi:FtsZ-binding cell division protein ZapB
MFAVVFTAALAAAAEKPTQTTTPPATAAEIEQLIGRLDSDQFGQREAAATQLKTLGKAAIPALRKAAVGDSLEVTCRAVDILRLLHESTDAATKTAAEAALKEIANSGHSAAAARAAAAIKPKPKLDANGNANAGANRLGQTQIFFGAFGGNAAGGINLQGNLALNAGVGRRMSVQNSNGVKTIEAEENDRKVKITEDAAGGIKMDVTTTKNGKEVTDKYEAKNADDLKKKNGPAYDLYKQYSSGQRGGAIAFGGAMGPGFMPNVPGQPNIRVQPLGGPMPVQAFGANTIRGSVDVATMTLKHMKMQLSNLTDKKNLESASQESRDALKKQVGQMREQLAELEKRLAALPANSELPAKPALPTPAAQQPSK